jgi:alkylation response protein AidB-like acyl-CoA dehydrogenase
MITTESPTMLEAIDSLLPSIVARREEIEDGRRLPLDLVAELTAAGCFRALVPRSHGGDEVPWPECLSAIEALSAADGSVGWTTALGAAAPILLGGLPAESYAAVYAGGPDVISASSFNPVGRATPVPGGYRVQGQWAFASGCQHSDWMLAHCVVDDGRQPPLRMMVVPMADVEIVDTWTTMGMCGTGSHDIRLDDVVVADEWTYSIFEPHDVDFTLLRMPELCLATMAFAAVAVGIASAALGEVVELAAAKVPMLASSALAANPLFRFQLGEADATLRAARALLHRDAEEAWALAAAGGEFDDRTRARYRSATAWIAATAAGVVDVAYRAGGGSALYRSNPLQRHQRDIHTLTQHFGLKLDTYTLAGAVFAGQEVDTAFL